mmetsp:Transcript_24714/g.40994  ORF Transcript_24714/g.40994 Transcript_24714/m.40994 type:complete len:88 (-) Transcript_24714:1089-1352(-)
MRVVHVANVTREEHSPLSLAAWQYAVITHYATSHIAVECRRFSTTSAGHGVQTLENEKRRGGIACKRDVTSRRDSSATQSASCCRAK